MGFDYRTSTGLGKQTLEGHKQNLAYTRTQEKGAVTSQETDLDLPVSVLESPVEVWVVACCKVGGTECAMPAWDLLKEVAIISITSTIPWPQVEQQGENTAPPINRKLDSRFTEHGPAYQTRPSFPIRKLP